MGMYVSGTICVTLQKITENRAPGELPYLAWIKPNCSNFYLYWLITLYQLYANIHAAQIVLGYDTLLFGYFLQICAQLAMLSHRWNVVFDEFEKSSKDIPNFSDWIEHHLAIIRFVFHKFQFSYYITLFYFYFQWFSIEW